MTATTVTSADTGANEVIVAREVHPRAIRWMHWINIPLMSVMVWSGLRIYWANDVYAAGAGPWQIFHFFPDSWYESLGLNFALARGIGFHFTVGWFFAFNGLVYLVYLAASGQWRHIIPDRRAWSESIAVAMHDLHLRKEAPPQGRYNAAQQITYTLVLVMGVAIVLSGVAIYRSTSAGFLTTLFGGYETARLIHFATTMGFLAFVVIHVLQVIRAGWGNFASMVTGWERVRPVTDADDDTSEMTA